MRRFLEVPAILVLSLALLGCGPPVDGLLRVPDPNPEHYGHAFDEGLIPGWKCPALEDVPHFRVIANPPCYWVPGGVFVKSCRDELEARRMKAAGCVEVAKTTIWYMMIPPVDDERRMNPSAPLEDWTIAGRYKTAPECDSARAALKPPTNESQRRLDLTQPVKDTRQDYIAAGARYAQCTTSNDPHLDAR
jgi:hypothetical protein